MASQRSLLLLQIMTKEAMLNATWRFQRLSRGIEIPNHPPRAGRGRNQRQLRKIARQVGYR
jgi:hypothetical protein